MAALLIVHGIAHLVGFVVSWKLATLAEMPYRTTIVAGAFDVRHTGIRVVGVMWLIAAIAFALLAFGAASRAARWMPLLLPMVGISAMLCIVGWPDARFGLMANALIVALFAVRARLDWSW